LSHTFPKTRLRQSSISTNCGPYGRHFSLFVSVSFDFSGRFELTAQATSPMGPAH
jgi:hypothetical protein